MTDNTEYLIITQKKLALILGGLAIALPTILYLGNLWIFGESEILSSVSNYYYSGMRDVFVGILFSMGLFLIAYEGYGFVDRVLSSLGGILAFVVALAPTTPTGEVRDQIGTIHIMAAALFYLILAIFVIFRFTKSDPLEPKTRLKKARNFVYYISGAIMILSLVLLVATEFDWVDVGLDKPTFWLEYLANSAFGTAWIVKGEGIFFLNDDPILEMNPWEVLGILILVLLALGSFFMLTNILLLT